MPSDPQTIEIVHRLTGEDTTDIYDRTAAMTTARDHDPRPVRQQQVQQPFELDVKIEEAPHISE